MEGLSDVELSVNVISGLPLKMLSRQREMIHAKAQQHENSFCGQENHKVPQLE